MEKEDVHKALQKFVLVEENAIIKEDHIDQFMETLEDGDE